MTGPVYLAVAEVADHMLILTPASRVAVKCYVCDAWITTNGPFPAEEFLRQLTEFVEKHKDCDKKERK